MYYYSSVLTHTQLSQRKRGGGAICIFDKEVANAFNNIIEDVESCSEATTPNTYYYVDA